MKTDTKKYNMGKFDMKEIDEENEKIIDRYDYMANAASTQDCTGLIPANPLSQEAMEAYEEIYHYDVPKIASEKK